MLPMAPVMENEKYRNMTISLKVAAEEKIMLKRLAEKVQGVFIRIHVQFGDVF